MAGSLPPRKKSTEDRSSIHHPEDLAGIRATPLVKLAGTTIWVVGVCAASAGYMLRENVFGVYID